MPDDTEYGDVFDQEGYLQQYYGAMLTRTVKDVLNFIFTYFYLSFVFVIFVKSSRVNKKKVFLERIFFYRFLR